MNELSAPADLAAGLDFFLPLQNRKWLKLLEPDAISGYRIRPNISLPASELGFSFSSNRLGLRGPDNVAADNLLIGTSFAMGFAVHTGQNWWESALDANWLNIGLPVGVNRLRALHDTVYAGRRGCAVVLYHPNFWQYARQYEDQAASAKTVHEFFGWQTDERFCSAMQAKILKMREFKASSGAAVAFEQDGVRHYMESVIYPFDFEKERDLVERSLSHWAHLLEGFDAVHLVRTRMKQELCPEAFRNEALVKTCVGFDAGWQIFVDALAGRNCTVHEASCISYDHFYPSEGHWTAEGNAVFAKWFAALGV